MDNLTNSVADMAAELNEARTAIDSLRLTVALQAQELDKLRVDNVMLRAATTRSQDRSVAMHTIMEQVSAGLISGLNRMQAADKATKRQQQADVLGVGSDGASPMYKPTEATPVAPTLAPARLTPRQPGKYAFPLGGPPVYEPENDIDGDEITDTTTGNVYVLINTRWNRYTPPTTQSRSRTAILVELRGGRPDVSGDVMEGDVVEDSSTGAAWTFNGQGRGWTLTRPRQRTSPPSTTGRGSIPRTDITDMRLPVVSPSDNRDADSLLQMHEAIGQRQV